MDIDVSNKTRTEMINYSQQGDQLFQQGDLVGAEEYYTAQFQIAKRLLEEDRGDTALDDYACSCGRMASICFALGHLEDAKAYSDDETEIAERLHKALGTVNSQRMLSVAYEHRGRILANLGNQDEVAAKYLIQCLAIRRQICERTPSQLAFEDLIAICSALGYFFLNIGRLQDAEALGVEMYDMAAQIEDEQKIDEALTLQYNIALMWYQRGVKNNEAGHPEQALNDLVHAREIGKRFRTLGRTVRRADGTEDDLRLFAALLQMQFANAHIALNHMDQAAQASYRGAERFEELWMETYSDQKQLKETCPQEYRKSLEMGYAAAGAYEFLGRIYSDWKNPVNCVTFLRRGMNIRWNLYNDTEDVEQLPVLGEDCLCIGEAFLAQGKNEDAGGHFQQSKKFLDAHYKETKDVNDIKMVCRNYQNLGHVCWNLEDWNGAKANYERTLDTMIELQKNTDFGLSATDLGDITQRLAKISSKENNREDALVYFRLCYEQRKYAAEEEPTAAHIDSLALAAYDLGKIRGDRNLLGAAYNYWDQLCKQFPNVTAYVQRRAIAEQALAM